MLRDIRAGNASFAMQSTIASNAGLGHRVCAAPAYPSQSIGLLELSGSSTIAMSWS
jgi:hypothetical protein